jgi:hypothetical protein
MYLLYRLSIDYSDYKEKKRKKTKKKSQNLLIIHEKTLTLRLKMY